MRLFPVKTKIIKTGSNLVETILESLQEQSLQLEDNDILALTSKIIAYAEGRVVKLSEITPSGKTKEIAQKFSLEPQFAELVLREADKIYGGVDKAVLALKDGVLTPNAGVDNKNAPVGYAVLWPKDVRNWVKHIKEEVERRTSKHIAVLIVDSGLIPLKVGTIGLALAVAGFKPVKDERGEKDIYGKPLVITQHAVADNIACAAHLLMGEAAEVTPLVVIRGAPVDFDNGIYGPEDMMMPFDQCVFMGVFLAGSRG